jgi:hypothetical protein
MALSNKPNIAEAPSFYKTWLEPESAANTSYANSQPIFPYNHVTQTAGGHSFELDDTPNRERVRLQHKAGTFVEMHPNGDQVYKVLGNDYSITIKDKNVLVQGNVNITVQGDAYISILGDKMETVKGNVEMHIEGDYVQTVKGVCRMSSVGDTIIEGGGAPTTGLKLKPYDYVYVSGDMQVSNEMRAGRVFSSGKIEATLGMWAGPEGYVTPFGGVSVGMPGVPAVPGQFLSSGTISSLTSVTSPLATHGIMGAIFSGDIVNNLLHNIHTHIAPLGSTSPPIPEEEAPT